MGTAALISVSEYLRTSYEPDAEYVDGHIEARPMGERDHSDLQRTLTTLLDRKEYRQYFTPGPEWRVQVSASRFRVPDVSLRRAGLPKEQIATHAPLLCIEVLSPEDTMQTTLGKVKDYLQMGVPEVWVFDTALRSVYVYNGKVAVEHTAGLLSVPQTPVTLDLAEVFSVLDED